MTSHSGVFNRKAGPGLRHVIKEREDYKDKLDLLYSVGEKIASVPEIPKLLDHILRMAQQISHASASSLLLIDQGKKELYFQMAEGAVSNVLQQTRVGIDSGIAGWSARNARPLISNDVTRDRRFNPEIDKISGFHTKSVIAVPLVAAREVIGVLEVLNKADASGFNERDVEVLMSLAATAAVTFSNLRLNQKLEQGYISTLKALVAAIDAKDPYTSGHSQRVAEYALLGANMLSLSPEELKDIEFGGLLHDIGKIAIDATVLRKPGDLTSEEWSLMRKHTVIGANIIKDVPFLERAKPLVLYHHENYDGSGYPEGLKGEAIPICARLLSVVDAFDTMTSERSYRASVNADLAVSELRRYCGTQFCPVATDAFISGFQLSRGKLPSRPIAGHRQLV